MGMDTSNGMYALESKFAGIDALLICHQRLITCTHRKVDKEQYPGSHNLNEQLDSARQELSQARHQHATVCREKRELERKFEMQQAELEQLRKVMKNVHSATRTGQSDSKK